MSSQPPPVQVTVTFDGICTFISQASISPPMNVDYRVVLLNVSGDNTVGSVMRIPPHTAKMTIGGTVTNLTGQAISIQVTVPPGEQPPPFTLDPSFAQFMPNLTELVNPIETLGPPSADVVTGNRADLVAAYFDITAGTLSASVDTGPTSASFQARLVISAPAGSTFTLIQAGFGGAPSETTPLQSGAIVALSNSASPQEEQDKPGSHFLLHYLTAAQLPSAPQIPQVSQVPFTETHDVPGTLGCSNSTYP